MQQKEQNDRQLDMEILLLRLDTLEKSVEDLKSETKEMLAAFTAAKGAFDFLEGLARVVKPILFIGGVIGAFILWVKGVRI